MLVDDAPEAVVIGIVGDALEHQRRRAVHQRAIDDIAVSGDPADVGGAPENLARPIVEAVMKGRSDPDRIAAGGDRKSVVSGKSVSVRVDLGGRRSIKKKK